MNPQISRPKGIYIIFAAVGIVVIIIGFIFAYETATFKQTALETTAVITKIHTYRGTSDDNDSHDVYVAFEIEDKEFRGKLNFYSSGMSEGEKIQIFYALENPNNFRYAGAGGYVTTIFFSLFGLIFALVGLIPLHLMSRRNALKKHLLQDGKKVMAKFRMLTDSNVTVNGRCGQFLVCEYGDHIYKSEKFWITGCPSDKELEGTLVPVYVQEDSDSKYCVDIDSFFDGVGNKKIKHQED